MADKYHSDTQEKIESIEYAPDYQTSGDLEAGSKDISATSKPVTPDYTTNLTTAAPDDSRWTVMSLCQRLDIRDNGFGGTPAATRLYYSVEVNGVERASGEFDGVVSNLLVAWTLSEGQFNLGSANQIDIFLWVDQGIVAIGDCTLWQGVGTNETDEWSPQCTALTFKHTGFLVPLGEARRIGTGTTYLEVWLKDSTLRIWKNRMSSSASMAVLASDSALLVKDKIYFRSLGSVATDLNYIRGCGAILRSVL